MFYTKEAIIEKAVQSYFELKKTTPSVEPDDGLIHALNGMGLNRVRDEEEFFELSRIVEIKARTQEFETDKELSEKYGYETLGDTALKACFSDFSKCEGQWYPIQNEDCKRSLDAARAVLEKMHYSKELIDSFEWSAAMGALEKGRVISLPGYFIRKRTNWPKCPLCGSSIMEQVPALSRFDNKTKICSECATQEALDDFTGVIRG